VISFLENIFKVLSELVLYVVAGAVTVVNLFFDGVGIAINAALGVLPEIGVGETKITPELLEEANWFFPFGGIIAVLTTMLTAYLIWLAVRYFLRLVRAA
jgi:hypothetical protein